MSRLLPLVFLVVVAACHDDASDKSVAPTAPVTAAAVAPPSAAIALQGVKISAGGSSVCLRYLAQRSDLQVRLEKAPSDTVLLRKARALTMKMADACN
jgi:hypothetical protein